MGDALRPACASAHFLLYHITGHDTIRICLQNIRCDYDEYNKY